MNLQLIDRLLIGLQLATALGIVVFWSWWFRAKHDESFWPQGYRQHEQAFVVPDLVLALLLVVSSLMSMGGIVQGSKLALVAAGMMLFLAIIDATYFVQQGMFSRERGGVGNALLVGGLLILSLVMILHHS
ncbi:MAG: hypothetical protein ACK5QX_03400 [bacterium]